MTNAALKISSVGDMPVPANWASLASRPSNKVIEVSFEQEAPALPPGFISLDEALGGLPISDQDIAAIREERIAIGARIAGTRSNAQRLSDLRRRAGLSQAELAGAIGTSQSRLSQLEAGKQDATLRVLERLKIALGVNWDELCEAALRCRK